jgi:hypothetical protein
MMELHYRIVGLVLDRQHALQHVNPTLKRLQPEGVGSALPVHAVLLLLLLLLLHLHLQMQGHRRHAPQAHAVSRHVDRMRMLLHGPRLMADPKQVAAARTNGLPWPTG